MDGSRIGPVSHAQPEKGIFGLRISEMDVADAARAIASSAGAKTGYPRMFVTPNIQHIAEMRTNKELRSALQAADIVTCDGFPVAKYARMRGCAIPGRVTGREVTEYLMRHANLADKIGRAHV